jgi:hypothetical protein
MQPALRKLSLAAPLPSKNCVATRASRTVACQCGISGYAGAAQVLPSGSEKLLATATGLYKRLGALRAL